MRGDTPKVRLISMPVPLLDRSSQMVERAGPRRPHREMLNPIARLPRISVYAAPTAPAAVPAQLS